ncbi:MAG TPA: carboxypeptidase-like regulatory domain-containing protein [Flavobacteriales bacterium]|nr:carboxypeptidase-like regulatory domain-containing protein [Flavobacteriales bacterium]
MHMKGMKNLLTILLLFFTVSNALSQAVYTALGNPSATTAPKEAKLIQFSGVILSADTLEPVSFASVYDKSIKRVTYADHTGFFSMVVRAGDTIMFSSYGYKKMLYFVPDTLSQNRYTIVQLLQPDVHFLDTLVVRPWPSREEFAKAFMDLELPRTAYDRYNENMTLAELKASNSDFGDALSCYDAQMSNEYSRLYRQGQIPTLNLLSPQAWRSFIKTWKSGGFKNKKNN